MSFLIKCFLNIKNFFSIKISQLAVKLLEIIITQYNVFKFLRHHFSLNVFQQGCVREKTFGTKQGFIKTSSNNKYTMKILVRHVIIV